MPTLISLLRGVNMTGHNSIRMDNLVDLYKNLGFADAESYIQSGNVVFNLTADTASGFAASRIEEEILKKFGFRIPVIIRNTEEVAEVIRSNPFLNEPGYNEERVSVIFLYDYPTPDQIKLVMGVDYPPDKFKIAGKEIFIYCPNGFGMTKLYTGFFENKMKVIGTARNWKTTNAIYHLAVRKQPEHINLRS